MGKKKKKIQLLKEVVKKQAQLIRHQKKLDRIHNVTTNALYSFYEHVVAVWNRVDVVEKQDKKKMYFLRKNYEALFLYSVKYFAERVSPPEIEPLLQLDFEVGWEKECKKIEKIIVEELKQKQIAEYTS